MLNSICKTRNELFKKGISAEDARKKRTDLTNQLRKEKKDNKMSKRRQIRELAIRVNSPNKTEQYEAVKLIRQALSIENTAPIAEVIQSGVVPTLVKFLYANDIQLQFESAWALTNIASGTSQQTQLIVDLNAIPAFVNLLQSPDVSLREQSIWALGNIAGDSPKCRDLVINANALTYILNQLIDRESNISIKRNATWALSNLCRGKPQPDFSKVSVALPILADLIKYTNDRDVLADACWSISYLSDGENKQIEEVMQTDITSRLVELLNSPYVNVVTPALRAIGNFVTGTDSQTQRVLDANVLPTLLGLLSNPKTTIVKEACWTISNIAAGNPNQVQLLFKNNIMPTIIQLLSKSYVIRKEAAWVIANATSQSNPSSILILVNQGVIPALCDTLKIPDIEIKEVVLNALGHILSAGQLLQMTNGSETNQYVTYVIQCGGADTLEALQDHPNRNISTKVQNILQYFYFILFRQYFPLEDDDEEETDANIQNSTSYNFGLNNSTQGSMFNGF